MKRQTLFASLVAAGLLAACASGPVSSPVVTGGSDLASQPLPANDGWAAAEGAVTGGIGAKAENRFTVTNRKELVAALTKGGKEPTIILVKGTINLSVDDNNKELTEKDYAVAPYDFNEYMKAYAPTVWNVKLEKGRPIRKLTGPQEEARAASQSRQKARIVVQVPSNTSLIGLDKDAKIVKGNLVIGAGSENVIIRNITFEDAFDYFPQWDPGDSFKIDASYPGCQEAYVDATKGPQLCPGGRWNSEYDTISINGGKRVWIDHCTFTEGDRTDDKFPPVFPFPHNEPTQKVQHHDGAVDVTNEADLVTISYSLFKDHDKTNLIGGSDSRTSDAGKLRVTFHNNVFDNVGQRMPRVRFGKVHTYNNLFVGDATLADDPKATAYENHRRVLSVPKPKGNIFRQALGAGKDSAIYSEANVFEIKNGSAEHAVGNMGGTKFFDAGSLVNGKPLDIKEAAGKPLSPDVGWKPTLYGNNKVKPAGEVPAYVRANAGAGKL
ncbi:MAG: PbsX family transcriptional regulator [Candidatus Dactylopiibacterium carminicum]|uniref:PbsX family transcriptional regulator n=1 Tax=Candidatus Dactylopiibacterium carminicum TaxID=857335 RepID=A0A272EMH7_9RHOO|nr:PbsX family transcriptional regulator [Candidatus Dactylopiibacterium carminicum]KAF7597696.1 PbsX family transcriptional regulator [Candidatus Dactylopiibacterium carminicum]PAS91305.1 MAG: PbsX family transcriptional regulator [Candidatus Dactylopiibacterium carminicum]PAS94223.1 MAG: PbsX family transcriptional regulator [Candidatus Dactylopiibacterium carminicum]